MTEPQVSVLMAVRNEEQFLPAALLSLQRQTLHDWELVVVDDGSCDRTPDILATSAQEDQRIRILSQSAEGLVSALNGGLQACRAPLVARMDGDDICHPRRLENQLQRFHDDPSVDLVACAVRHFPRGQIHDGMLNYETWQNGLQEHCDILRNLFVESPFAHPSVIYRRSQVLAAGGYLERPWAEDYDLWLRLAERRIRFASLAETLLYWRDRPRRLTRTAANCTLAAFRSCKAHYLRRGYLRNLDEITLWGAGHEGKAWRKVLLREGVRVNRWIDVDPRKIGQRIHGAEVFPPDILQQDPAPTLITVGARGARVRIREWAHHAGLTEGSDFICVT
ncbi:MAG: glycosyltransferase [Desulfuromonadales bacterium]|nr:glycosyltransferase [Desulfuromonadales bacterium]